MPKRPPTEDDFKRDQEKRRDEAAKAAERMKQRFAETDAAEPAKSDEPEAEAEPTKSEPKPSRAVLADRETRIQRGEEAIGRLTSDMTWVDWLAVCEGLEVGRGEAMTEAQTNQPKGSAYNKAFGGWLDRHPAYRKIDQADRKRCFDVLDNRADIEDWRAKALTPNQRMRLNHPSTVFRRWKAKTQPKTPKRQPSSLLSPALQERDRKIVQQAARIKEIEEERDSAREANGDFMGSDYYKIARALVAKNAGRAVGIANAILETVKRSEAGKRSAVTKKKRDEEKKKDAAKK
jgi:hypothetical protein